MIENLEPVKAESAHRALPPPSLEEHGGAKRFWFGRVGVIDNVAVAEEIYRLRVWAPEIAQRITPGQFVMVRLPETIDPLLGRAFALYDVAEDATGGPAILEIVYEVVGKMTRRLARMGQGAELEVWGPLGNGFPAAEADHWILVAGGIGITPFLAFAKQAMGLKKYGHPPLRGPFCQRLTLCYGSRTAARLACVHEFNQLGVEVLVSTDDGSAGRRGVVTELLLELLGTSGCAGTVTADPEGGTRVQLPPKCVKVLACGPEVMLRETAQICLARGIPCWVSLETPMACGIGICFSCAVPVRTGSDDWDYRRACVEGPVFPAEVLAWEVFGHREE